MKYSEKKAAAKTSAKAPSAGRSLFSHGHAQAKASGMKSGGCKTCGKRKG